MNIEPKDEKDEQAQRAKKMMEMTMPHLTVDSIRTILDPSGDNITFPTTAKMKELTGKWLVDADRDHFNGLNAEQSAILDVVKKVRNFLAHRSQNADVAMQDKLVAAALAAELRRGQNNVGDVGAYLRANQQGQPRFRHYLSAVRVIATQLCP